MSGDETDSRLAVLENDVGELKQALSQSAAAIERHSQVLERVAEKIEQAINLQSNSLSMPVLQMLVPLLAKLFIFFGLLVLGFIGGVFSIKWLFVDMLLK